ncbi:MAG: FMN-binding negative transcriptional regulator [Erythrobacter sp.]
MHPTRAFRHDDAGYRHDRVAQIGFGMIFLTTPDGPRVAHTPVMLAQDGATIRFHLARTNALTPHLDTQTALIAVNGPDGYVSARWYEAANQVPTWNYIAFEFEGRINRIDDSELLGLVTGLSNHHEARVKHGTPWTMDKLEDKARDALLRGIVGFEMQIDRVRETVKLSQNKPEDERQRLIEGLESEGAHALVRAMQEIAP